MARKNPNDFREFVANITPFFQQVGLQTEMMPSGRIARMSGSIPERGDVSVRLSANGQMVRVFCEKSGRKDYVPIDTGRIGCAVIAGVVAGVPNETQPLDRRKNEEIHPARGL